MSQCYRGRFAPSPTGPLHFGSLLCAVASYLDARQRNGTWLIRMEDVDGVRCKPEYAEQILATLNSYQLISDEPVRFQLPHADIYEYYLDQLKQHNHVFPCNCTRQSLVEHQGRHPDICQSTTNKPHSWRLKTQNDVYRCHDAIQGTLLFEQDLTGNHPILKRKDGYFSYQLAVVIDDHKQGITHLVRGADLIDTTAQQLYLFDLFGWPPPKLCHIPLIVNEQREKISKQNHAKAVPNGDLATLKRVMYYLGIQTDHTTNIQETLIQAIPQWSPNTFTKQRVMTLQASDTHFL
ncbi:Glutamyl-Q tRNA(Asp) synthetase [Marinomonas spartinae]|uniref:Glutamyl-Q tRNA(Asp) synthetase n=1 Tax=Marinomonas spartinae TaxID=1792290 RepID=A0A1A8TUR1_9GAMM|nr:tRNA glutamyl-Q(34) synthetase GluQRS [Marinomonas spartinae]SBS37382.1 Glutamyl-Q tRNA(Asp) synthetase [Marinomonas spartinae]